MTQKSLDTLKIGENGTIEDIASSTSNVRQRLLEMGLTKGTLVKVIRFAPMGDPIEIALRGYRLSLRREEARSIMLNLKRA